MRKLVKDDPGVIKIRMGRKKAHTIYSVPESAACRIHTRLLNAAQVRPPESLPASALLLCRIVKRTHENLCETCPAFWKPQGACHRLRRLKSFIMSAVNRIVHLA